MTRNEFYEKYGNELVGFSAYYKFTFTFVGELADGKRIVVNSGGNSDDIYREEVNTDLITVNQASPYSGTVYTEDGQEFDSFYDY